MWVPKLDFVSLVNKVLVETVTFDGYKITWPIIKPKHHKK